MSSTTQSSITTQITYIYLQNLQRYPTDQELNLYTQAIQNNKITYDQISQQIQQSKEYKQKNDQWYGNVQYDGLYTVTLTQMDKMKYQSGMILGNGNLIGFTDNKGYRIQKISIVGQYTYNNLYQSNLIKTFNSTKFQFGNNMEQIQSQQINMQNGIVSQIQTVIDQSTQVQVTITSEGFLSRQFQNCIQQDFTLNAQQQINAFPMTHYMDLQDGDGWNNESVQEIDFYTTQVEFQNTVYQFFVARGQTEKHNLVTISLYSFQGYQQQIKGLNIFKNKNEAYNQFSINLQQNQDTVVSVYSVYFGQPKGMSNKNQLTSQGINQLMSIQQIQCQTLKQNHIGYWLDMYNGDIIMIPKDSLSQQDQQTFTNFQLQSRIGIYTLYSITNNNIFQRTKNFVSDPDGEMLSQADIWYLPCLIILQPNICKNMLYSRYQQILQYKNFVQDSEFSQNSQDSYYQGQLLLYDQQLPYRIYNLGFIAVSAWNCYRITQDTQYLQSIGVKILKEVSEFFLSIIKYDKTSDQYYTDQLKSLNNTQTENNSLINYLIYMTLKYTTQAHYQLKYRNYQQYLIYTKIRFNLDQNLVNQYDKNGYIPTPFDYMEQLLITSSYYNQEFIGKYQNPPGINDQILVGRGLQQYSQNVNQNQVYYLTNLLLMADNYSYYAQCLPQQSDRVQQNQYATQNLQTFLDNSQMLMPFKIFSIQNNQYGFLYPGISLYSQFLLYVLTGLGGFVVQGQNNASDYHTQQMTLQRHNNTVFPGYIKTIEIDCYKQCIGLKFEERLNTIKKTQCQDQITTQQVQKNGYDLTRDRKKMQAQKLYVPVALIKHCQKQEITKKSKDQKIFIENASIGLTILLLIGISCYGINKILKQIISNRIKDIEQMINRLAKQ